MIDEVILKINNYVKPHLGELDEPLVVYLMVTVRKILDREFKKRKKFLLLRFYSDWTVHTEKTQNLEIIKEVMDEVDKCVTSRGNTFDVHSLKFIFMPELKTEMKELFKQFGLLEELFSEKKWFNFVDRFAQVLANQPLLDPIPSIKKFEFQPSPDGIRSLDIEFNDKRGHISFIDGG